ncbi:multiprotein-bridging factor 1 family protein [Acidiferrimicrobium sp. IK]|uniref:helix-turn-helix domain-containing protein n=1 Tax=Acidiferrimicrobium sp. IK TaxID=2871700 RepID=UPI0021CB079D|nr:helix-turn-helix transcriptional regulator [Acidiferrimicrobium sp. IK]
MAPTMIDAQKQAFAARLRKARDASDMSLKDVMIKISHLLPQQMWVTDETIRQYETGRYSEKKANPVLLAALATAYDVKLADLSPYAAATVGQLLGLLGDHHDGFFGPPGMSATGAAGGGSR